MSGTYNFDKPVVINHLMKDITIEPYGDGEVIFSGGKKIEGWKRIYLTVRNVFPRLFPK